MSPPHSFTDLEVWQRSMDLVDFAYACTKKLPRDEFDLRRQIRDAAVSIPANLAEGYRRRRRQAYQNHVSIAMGSHAEMQTELEIAFRNGLLHRAEWQPVVQLSERVGAMLYRLYESLDT
jgi:four helix bundle protein